LGLLIADGVCGGLNDGFKKKDLIPALSQRSADSGQRIGKTVNSGPPAVFPALQSRTPQCYARQDFAGLRCENYTPANLLRPAKLDFDELRKLKMRGLSRGGLRPNIWGYAANSPSSPKSYAEASV